MICGKIGLLDGFQPEQGPEEHLPNTAGLKRKSWKMWHGDLVKWLKQLCQVSTNTHTKLDPG